MDTSVVIAGAAALRDDSLQPKTESGDLLVKWLDEEHFDWLYSEAILDEYKELLARFRIRPALIGRFNNLLREAGVAVRVPRSGSISPDPDDDPFCACAQAGRASFIVTLNPRDFPQDKLDAKVIKPGATLPVGASRRVRKGR